MLHANKNFIPSGFKDLVMYYVLEQFHPFGIIELKQLYG